eukprot:c53583_g1_i1 orf=426-2087(+)
MGGSENSYSKSSNSVLIGFVTYILIVQFCWFGNCSTTRYYEFKVEHKPVRKLCSDRSILTVNGQYPGPTIYAQEGDRVIVKVTNTVSYNVTLHWHGVRQQFSCWSDGAAYVTQCPIQTGRSYTYEFTIYQQRGTMFWHAHVGWLRATIHGAIVIYPITGMPYPFNFPYEEHVLILGEYWSADLKLLEEQTLQSGITPPADAYTINGHPGPLYSCSTKDTFILNAVPGKTYLLRMINAGINVESVFEITNHELTVVAVDGSYTRPFKISTLVLTPGQTADVLFTADQESRQYYMGMGPYIFDNNAPLNHALSLAVLKYIGSSDSSDMTEPINLQADRNGTGLMLGFMSKLRSFSIAENNLAVPDRVDQNLFYTVGINNINATTLPRMAVLQAYYYGLDESHNRADYFDDHFLPYSYYYNSVTKSRSKYGIPITMIPFNSNVQLVLQDTSLTTSTENHPVHLHGHSFYVVGFGLGKYSPGSARFNLEDPPLRNTVAVPGGGWAVIRFKADNPGVWFMHCHYNAHVNWGTAMAFIVKDGKNHMEILPPPPADLPAC